MYKSVLKLFLIFLGADCINVYAQDWRVDLGIGGSEIKFDGVTAFDDQVSDEDVGASIEIGVGYHFLDSGYARLSYVDIESLTEVILLLDNFDYSSIRVGVGYEWRNDSPVVFGAEIGAAFWEVEGTEAIAFNPGPEQTGTLDGTDLYLKGSIGYKINQSFTLSASLDYENNDFGSVSSFRILGQFSF